MWDCDSFSEIYFVSFPIITPSSTSQSDLIDFFGISTSSFGPITALVALENMIGSGGTFWPVSSAWSE